jgi:hypothetical protein
MSLQHSPSIVTSGLVMYYDMANTKRSFKGQPTTNLVPYPDADWNGSGFALSYNYPTAGATYSYITNAANPINSPEVLRYYTGTTAYKYWAIQGSVPAPGTYTFSYYARMSDGGPSNITNGQLWRDSGTDRGVSGDWNPTFTTEWVRYSTTGYVTSYLDYFPVHSGSILGGYTIDYCGFQLEAGSYATPYVNGTRSNTQTIVDLTGNSTITANSLTYAADNTFSFNGTSDYIQVARTLTTPITVSSFMKYTDQSKTADMFLNSYPHAVLGISINRSGGGQLVVYIGNGSTWLGTPSITSSVNMTVNVWYQITFVSNGTTSDLYVNDVYVGSAAHAPSGWGNFFDIGMIVQTGEYFKGSIATTQIYNRALSAAEVAQNFNALRGRYGI